MSVASPGYVSAEVTNRAAAGRQVTVKVQFTVPRGEERKLTVARQDPSTTHWTPVSLTGKQGVETSVVTGTYRLTLRKGANPFRLRVTPGFRTTQNSQTVPVAMSLVNAQGRTLSKDTLDLHLDLLKLTPSATAEAALRRGGGWNETAFTLANGSSTHYRTVTVRTYQSCYGPNYSTCPKSSFKLQWFSGGQWRAVATYIPPRKPGVDVDKMTVLTRVSVPVGASRQFRLRIAATTTARPGSTGRLEVDADSGSQSVGPWAFEGTSVPFTIR